jgi:hypothetical protein
MVAAPAADGREAVWGNKQEQAVVEKEEEEEAAAESSTKSATGGGLDSEAMQALQAFNAHGDKAIKPKGQR